MIALLALLLAVVNSPNPSITYACDGSTAAFTVNFPYLAYTDLLVTSITPAGGATTLTYTTDYTVNLASTSSTATLTLTSPSTKCPFGNTLKIYRTPAITQPTSFKTQTTFNPALHEQAYDRVVMQIQEVKADGQTYANSAVAAGLTSSPMTWVATGTGAATVFALSGATVVDSQVYQVTIDGVMQRPTTDYSVNSVTQQITFIAAPALNANIMVRSLSYVQAAQLPAYLCTSAGCVSRSMASKLGDIVHAKDFGAVCDGVTDDQPAITNAITAVVKGVVQLQSGVCILNSTLTVPSFVTVRGVGPTDNAGVTGGTVLKKNFNGQGVILTGDTAALVELQVDSAGGKTGDGVQIKSSRAYLRRVVVTSQGRDGIRIGDDEGGAETINANLWRLDQVGCIGNTRNGLYIHESNTTTNATFPQGNADVNSGLGTLLDLRSNGGDGLKIRNSIDNRFDNVTSQSNTGYGIHFELDARSHHISGLYTESNVTGDVLIDSGANTNAIWGMRYVTNLTITDNGTANLIFRWNGNINRWIPGSQFDIYNDAGAGIAKLQLWADVNGYNAAAIQGSKSGTNGGLLELITRNTSGGGASRKIGIDDAHHIYVEDAGFATYRAVLAYSGTIATDPTAGNSFSITATNNTAFTISNPSPNPYAGQRVLYTIRNTSGGALGAITWGANFKVVGGNTPWTGAPANTTSRSIEFIWDGTNLVELWRGATDVPN